MQRTQYLVLSISLLVTASATLSAQAADGSCAGCGCAVPCQKVCRLEVGEKKVEIICWGCKKEDFCVASKSARGCEHCETVCENCDEDADTQVCSKSKNFVWFDWMPGGAKIYTKTKLMKRVETVTVPSFKWVVEDMCVQCAASAAAAEPGTIVYSVPDIATLPADDVEKPVFDIATLPKWFGK